MDRKGAPFAGVSVALTTPFRGGEVDYDRFAEQIEFQLVKTMDDVLPLVLEQPFGSVRRPRSAPARSGEQVGAS